MKDKKRLFAYFGAINYLAEVYLNGKKLGIHEGGFTPFNFEITQIVKPKDNFLVVKVDNKRRPDGVPTINTDWWNYGGITRDVVLIEEPSIYIQSYSLQIKKGEKNKISGSVNLENAAAFEPLTISIPELNFETKLMSGTNGKTEFEVLVPNLELWSPETPKLYQVFIKTKYQTLKDDIGFRALETRGADILLNGKPVFLRGISIHEESNRGGRGYSRGDAARLLNWAKDLGCNFVRLAHYPHNENMVKMADEMGLLVWEEIPVYWTIDFENVEVLNKSKQQLYEVITRDRNRASVIIWSIANETPIYETRNKFIKSLADYTRNLDSTRLISAALMHRQENGLEVLDDPIGKYMDILAFNQYLGWYGGDLATAEMKKWSIPFDKPVIVSEFGGDAKFGLRGSKNERWTEDYQGYLYQQNLKMIDKIPNMKGLSPWILVDFRSPRRLLPEIQDGYNRKGLISNDGNRKLAFYVLQNYYKLKGATKNYQLVWAEEFNYSGRPDSTKWSYETGYIRNHEKQYYTDRQENVRVESGNLVIEARNESMKNSAFTTKDDKNWRFNKEFSDYTSASVTTKDKAEWLYGKIEVRAKLPKGRGAWSAIWMLGANWKEAGWPKCGEIDIMENVGFDENVIHGTIHTEAYNHTKNTQRGKTHRTEDAYSQFHIYSIEWTPEKIDFMVDGKIYNTFNNEQKTESEWAFDQKFHLKINNAIGGDWGGQKGIDDLSFPQKMFVDWVRVYQLK